VGDVGVAEDEVAEVVAVLHEAAVAAAAPAALGAWQREPSFARQASGELAIVLERTGTGAYFVRDVPTCARVTAWPNTVARALFYLDRRGVRYGCKGRRVNVSSRRSLSQPVWDFCPELVSGIPRRNTSPLVLPGRMATYRPDRAPEEPDRESNGLYDEQL
jgi:KaiC/GvpD/RAD55 family RecA-like ATPase